MPCNLISNQNTNIITNLLILFRWRVPTNIFLCNVAVADLIICLWTLPLMIGSINRGRLVISDISIFVTLSPIVPDL